MVKIEIDTNEFNYKDDGISELESIITLLNSIIMNIKKEKKDREVARQESRIKSTKARKDKKVIVISADKDIDE